MDAHLQQNTPGDVGTGTGSGFGKAVIIVAGVSALVATLLTIFSTYLQTKNYRKPLLQRHVIRIFMLVPIFGIASFASLTSLNVAFWVDPFRDVYEAFTLYTFFQLLVAFLGGERSLIIMMHGRPPVSHLWPLNYCLAKVDISDPHTFLGIKRGILQYTWIKPMLAFATIIMKATNTYEEGKLNVTSGYLWVSVIYNVSICLSLYDLALFWVCMSEDLQPFRPMPKFLCIKGIIFASWWQGFFLSCLVAVGAIPSLGGGYTADNLAAAIQDFLICVEMPFFALSHWYAFSWKDYSDKTISDARMPIRFALRDAFGPRDLIEDAKETLKGDKYEYRYFDANDNVMAHEESSSLRARMREGMRYSRDGRGKYWIPSPNAEVKQPLLSKIAHSHARTMSPSGGGRKSPRNPDYGTSTEPTSPRLDPDEDAMYESARELEYGDWNYPVINTHFATQEDRLYANPNMLSASTNRAILQPTKAQKKRRQSRIKDLQEHVHHGEHGESSSSDSSDKGNAKANGKGKGKERLKSLPVVGSLLRHESSDSVKSHSSQLVDLVVEDEEAEAIERVRARKEGGPGWNAVEQKHYVQTYRDDGEAVEEIRHGFNPDKPEQKLTDKSHALDEPFGGPSDKFKSVNDEEGKDETGRPQPWESRHDETESPFEDERKAWHD